MPLFPPLDAAAPPRWRALTRVLCTTLLAALLAACQSERVPLPNDAYVWQRVWNAPVTDALGDSAGLVRTWRVLAGETSAGGRDIDARPDLAALAATQQPVVMVLRIDGRADTLDAAPASVRIGAWIAQWRAAGVRVAGVEIDYDCATSQLPVYTEFLASLRKTLDVPLSITALPTWLDSRALDALLATVDESVLQVHAVMAPSRGLFDAERARAWLKAYATRTTRPWRVALPAYGSRVAWDDSGRVVAIESERPALQGGGRDAELLARPQLLAEFVASLERDAPDGLAGIVWFRLPTQADQRAWSLPTWQAVLARAPLAPRLSVQAQAPHQTGARDLLLANTGNADAELPFVVRLGGSCRHADGINGYTLEYDDQGLYLRRAHEGLLRPGFQRNIGWIRCDDPTSFQVQP